MNKPYVYLCVEHDDKTDPVLLADKIAQRAYTIDGVNDAQHTASVVDRLTERFRTISQPTERAICTPSKLNP